MSIPHVRCKAVAIAFQAAFGLLWTGFSGSIALANSHSSDTAQVIDAYRKLPLSFEANQGQTDKQVKFLSRGPGYALFLTPTEAVLSLKAGHGQHTGKASLLPVASGPKAAASHAAVLRIRLEHANRNAKVSGIDELAGKSNYFIGNDPAKWRSEIPTFGRVKYQEVYSGVDLVYYGNQRQLEYDFLLAPGADPKQIELSFAGATGLRIDAKGDLVVGIAGGEFVEHRPVIYQNIDGMRRQVAGGFELRSGHMVGFKLAAYDHRERLTIDPSLIYSTYLGGNGGDAGYGIAVDSSGNAYVTGCTSSSDFPITSGSFSSGGGAFVSKLNSSGSALLYSAVFGPGCATGIAVDSPGNAYVTGYTNSRGFPVTPGALITDLRGEQDAFVTKLNTAGTALLYSTYLGGSLTDGFNPSISSGFDVAIDSSNNAYVTGYTYVSDFPTTTGAVQTSFAGGTDVFVSKLNSTGSALLYSTYLGGQAYGDVGTGIAVDSSNNAYVTGYTYGADFPTTPGAVQTRLGGGADAFVSKLNSSGSALVYSTYLGGGSSANASVSADDFATDVAVDSSGNAYITGNTLSTDFPTTPGAAQTRLGGGADAFVSKLNSTGSALLYSTYLGGSRDDHGEGIVVDSSNNAYVIGATFSSDFPTTAGAVQASISGGTDVFVSKLNSSGALVYSTYLGGSGDDAFAVNGGFFGRRTQGIAVDSSNNAYVIGTTFSADFPTTEGALQTTFDGGESDAFVSKISFCSQPKTRRDCKRGGWHRFCGPSFKNQGQCVAFVNHIAHANDKATARFSAGLFLADTTDYPASQKAVNLSGISNSVTVNADLR